jgi:hypothetical protein
MYKLKDTLNDDVKGRYYAHQLRIAPDPSTIEYEIEKILATRKRNNKTQYLGKYNFLDRMQITKQLFVGS